jgi:hypothetical protein
MKRIETETNRARWTKDRMAGIHASKVQSRHHFEGLCCPQNWTFLTEAVEGTARFPACSPGPHHLLGDGAAASTHTLFSAFDSHPLVPKEIALSATSTLLLRPHYSDGVKPTDIENCTRSTCGAFLLCFRISALSLRAPPCTRIPRIFLPIFIPGLSFSSFRMRKPRLTKTPTGFVSNGPARMRFNSASTL